MTLLKGPPKWLQFAVAALAVIGISYFGLKPFKLALTEPMRQTAEIMKHGSPEERGRSIWDLKKLPAEQTASFVPVLLGFLQDETPVPAALAREVNDTRTDSAREMGMFMPDAKITVGYLAADAISRIRMKLYVDSTGDARGWPAGNPAYILAAVRKEMDRRLLPAFCSANELLKQRILFLYMHDPGHTTPIPYITSCGFNDEHASVRLVSAAMFSGYAHPHPDKCLPAVPGLISLLSDKNRSVSDAALRSLEIISGRNFGTDQDQWQKWFREKN
ncbi:MAG: hypothetical protein ABUL52_01145 [Solimonas sp.]